MTFAQLRALHAVALTGNVTRAAEQLLMTQPAVSHAIRGLERELGVALLVRRAGGVSLTAVGASVAERAGIILAQLESLRADASAAADQTSVTLRLGVLPSANARLVPPLLRAYATAHPDVRVTVIEGSDSEVLDWLRTGAVDVAVVAQAGEELVTAPLAVDELLAVIPLDHPLAAQGSVAIADLGHEPFIMSTGGCEPIVSALARAADVRLRRHYEVRDTASIAAMVRERLGVTIMPELSIPDDRSGLRVLPLDPAAHRRLSLAVLADAEPLAAAVALMRLAEERSGLVWSGDGADHHAVRHPHA
jgi:DNA-binding transcriptional LysR family regulator